MKFTTTAVLAASLAASSTFAGFLPTGTLTASGIAGFGAYSIPGNTWTITFSFNGNVNASGMNADFGSWSLNVSGSNGASWTTSSDEVSGGTWIRSGSDGRILTIALAEGTPIPGIGTISPRPTYISVKYTTRKDLDSGTWESLGNALLYSAKDTTPAARRGELRIVHGDTDEIAGTFTAVIPAPGAVALVGLAGLMISRRRA